MPAAAQAGVGGSAGGDKGGGRCAGHHTRLTPDREDQIDAGGGRPRMERRLNDPGGGRRRKPAAQTGVDQPDALQRAAPAFWPADRGIGIARSGPAR